MHDGTSAWLNENGPCPWSARSPDLNPFDFFSWDHLKFIIYETVVENEVDFRQRIINGCQQIRQMPGIFENVR